MGKARKGFNWKARHSGESSTTENKTDKVKNIEVKLQNGKGEHYDDCNALVLQPKKKKEGRSSDRISKPAAAKYISKKRRKELEKIIERKKKKENRSNLLAALAQVQAPDEVLNQLTSITTAQTKGVKQLLNREEDAGPKYVNYGNKAVLNSIKGSKGKHIFRPPSRLELLQQKKDPSIVGFDASSEDSDDHDCASEGDDDDDVAVEEGKVKNEEEVEKGKNEMEDGGVIKSEVVANLNSNWEITESRTVLNSSQSVDIVCWDDLIPSHNKQQNSDNLVGLKKLFDSKWSVSSASTSPKLNGVNSKKDCSIKNNFNITSVNDKKTDTCVNGFTRVNNKFTVINTIEQRKEIKDENNSSLLKRCNDCNAEQQKDVKKLKSKPAVFVPVNRKAEIQEARMKLPILSEEQGIMEAINENPIVILSGETGSGKTTQVPQFLYEAGYSLNGRMVGVTEPRRVAAISMAQRVADELNLSSEKVSYLIRFEGNVTPKTEIKFMTDGVLLKEIQTDFLLKKYSVIIIDEAHERSVYTDILIGLLSRIVPLRNKRGDPLKLIIMSATLRLNDFTDNKRLFKVSPPVLKVESRQYPVTIHFNRRTNPDYLSEAYRKACKIHTQLPEGGILIFVTGQQEVKTLVRKLRNAFPVHRDKRNEDARQRGKYEHKAGFTSDDDGEIEIALERSLIKGKKSKKKLPLTLPQIDLSKYGVANDDTEGDLLDEIDSEEDLDDDAAEGPPVTSQPMWVLPLYSLLPGHEQAKVFKPPPEGCRLCVVATNVAETSLTIPNVKYVVDSGKAKTKVYDKHTGISAFTVLWTSKAAANQRAGRAGRTGPGHCYRLYASAVFNDMFMPWSEPEIRRRPVDDLLLQLKALGIDRVVNFPFPTPPDMVQLQAAEKRLILLAALSPTKPLQQSLFNKNLTDTGDNSRLTSLGEAMSVFPIAPRFAKMLLLSDQKPGLMEYMVAIVAALSVQELLLMGDQRWYAKRNSIGVGHSLLLGDIMVLLKAVGAAEYAHANGTLEQYCTQNGLRMKAVIEVRKLRTQLTNELKMNIHGLDSLFVNPTMKPPTDIQAKLLRQIILGGMVDQVAARVPEEEALAAGIRKGKAAYQIMGSDQFVFIHSTSSLYKEQPQWLTYQQVTDNGSKMHLRGVTCVEPEWLTTFAPTLCNLTVQKESTPTYNMEKGVPYCYVNGSFGPNGWQLPYMEVEYPHCLDRCRWFAVFILDGTVCRKLSKYTSSLLSPPTTMIKSWARVVPRTQLLLKALADKEVSSKRELLSQWAKNSKYLLAEYLEWIPVAGQNEITMIWPPVDEAEELTTIPNPVPTISTEMEV